MRWLLIDRFEIIEKGKYAEGTRAVTRSEGALTDDYPSFPVMPPSLLVEMMAQVGGVLTGASIDFSKEVVLAKVSDAKFSRRVTPPSVLRVRAEMADLGDDAAVTQCRVECEGEPVAEAVIFFGLFPGLGGPEGKKIVFSENFMQSFAIRETLASRPRSVS